MEDNIFYYFVDYYRNNSKNDNHFKKFHLLLEKLKSEYESNTISRKNIYKTIKENILEEDREYTGCIQMVKRLNEWSNL